MLQYVQGLHSSENAFSPVECGKPVTPNPMPVPNALLYEHTAFPSNKLDKEETRPPLVRSNASLDASGVGIANNATALEVPVDRALDALGVHVEERQLVGVRSELKVCLLGGQRTPDITVDVLHGAEWPVAQAAGHDHGGNKDFAITVQLAALQGCAEIDGNVVDAENASHPGARHVVGKGKRD